jgi:hypothetical protein
MLDTNSHIVLDVPEPAAGRVMTVRRDQRDDFGASLPVEITVAGSTGVGELEPDQDAATVFMILDDVAADTVPIQLEFGTVLRFPNTDTLVLTVKNEVPLVRPES